MSNRKPRLHNAYSRVQDKINTFTAYSMKDVMERLHNGELSGIELPFITI